MLDSKKLEEFKRLFDEEDVAALKNALNAEWLVKGGETYNDRLTIAVRLKGGGFHNLAWFPWGFPRKVVEAVVDARNAEAAR